MFHVKHFLLFKLVSKNIFEAYNLFINLIERNVSRETFFL